MFTFQLLEEAKPREPWNKGKLVGQRRSLKLKGIWGIRIRLQINNSVRDLALFNFAIDSKLRGCDLVRLKVSDVTHSSRLMSRADVMQRKTGQPVQFEITEETQVSVSAWLSEAADNASHYLFTSRIRKSAHLSTRQYARIAHNWFESIGLDPSMYGTHSMRRTKATLIYRRTKNLRAVQLLLGHTKLESTVRYLGVEVDVALELAEQTEI